MRVLLHYWLTVVAVITIVPGRHSLSWASILATDPANCPLLPVGGPIQDTQPLAGAPFIGNAAQAKRLPPKFEFTPSLSNVHLDGGNTNTQDYPGPLGQNLIVTSVNVTLEILLWDAKGRLFAAYLTHCVNSNTTVEAVAEVDPHTLAVEAEWSAPANVSLNYPYMQLLTETDEIIITSQQGQIFLLQRTQQGNRTSLTLARTVDLASTDVLDGVNLLTALYDSANNLWFSTGTILGLGEPVQPATIIGYIESDAAGTIHHLRIPNQMVENGLAISKTTVFLATGPSGADDNRITGSHDPGFMLALGPGPGKSVTVLWNATYDAGDKRKPGSFSRGTGTTPALMGEDFLAVADNANPNINLLIYRQHATRQTNPPLCTIPLFTVTGPSATENGPIVHFDGQDYSVVVQNMYNESAYLTIISPTDGINGPANNFSAMSPGSTKVTVRGDGSGCTVDWTVPIRMTTLPILSTSTGLLYGYVQSETQAEHGQWLWYATAIDHATGETVWQVRTGAGGWFNDVFRNLVLGPDGTFYQLVRGGVVLVRDGPAEAVGWD